MRRSYTRLQETLFDLYTERDALPSYYRVVALVASWLALGGYVLFAVAFTSDESNIRPGRAAVVATASAFIIAGYAVSVLAAFVSRSLLFVFDAILLPILTSSLMGLFITVTNHVTHREFEVPSRAFMFVPLITALVSSMLAAAIAFIVHRKIRSIQRLDQQRRQHVPRWEQTLYANPGDASATTELLPMTHMSPHQPPSHLDIPEDEAQRRQLLRLLLSRDSAESPGQTLTPNTYHIALPGEETGSPRTNPIESRPRGGSLPASPHRFSLIGKKTREPSPVVESFKNPRERRREEIERSSALVSPLPGLDADSYQSSSSGAFTR